MKSFLYLLGISILFSVITIAVLRVNKFLAEQNESVCYIGMVTIDIFAVITFCAYIWKLCGIV